MDCIRVLYDETIFKTRDCDCTLRVEDCKTCYYTSGINISFNGICSNEFIPHIIVPSPLFDGIPATKDIPVFVVSNIDLMDSFADRAALL